MFTKIELWTSKQVKNDTTGCGNIFHYRPAHSENFPFFVIFDRKGTLPSKSHSRLLCIPAVSFCGPKKRSYRLITCPQGSGSPQSHSRPITCRGGLLGSPKSNSRLIPWMEEMNRPSDRIEDSEAKTYNGKLKSTIVRLKPTMVS